MEEYNRKSVFTELKKYDVFADESSFIEVTEWSNSDGVDVEIVNRTNNKRFQLTWGEFDALKKIMKTI